MNSFGALFCISVLVGNHCVSATEGTTTENEVFFSDDVPFKMVENSQRVVLWHTTVSGVKNVEVSVEDEVVAVVTSHEEFYLPKLLSADIYLSLNVTEDAFSEATVLGLVNISAQFIGFNKVNVRLLGENNQSLAEGYLKFGVILQKLIVNKVYVHCLTVILVIVYTNMGANLDLQLVKKIVKQPVGPAIGLFCQYGCMPLISFCLGLLLFPNDPLYRLGLFASGSAPGGGLSNMWTHLLGGSLDLSIMMTFTSTVVALGAVPFWLLTLGKVIVKDADLVIPYINVILGIITLLVPCFIGIVIQLKCLRLTKLMRMTITPLSVFNIVFIFSFGVYANFYLFSYITWSAVLAGFGQSICGHLAGIIFALIFRRSWAEVIAISIETAVQNNGVAFVLLKLSLGSPEGDLAVLMPGAVTLFMPLPLLIAVIIRIIYLNCFKKLAEREDQSNKQGSRSKSNGDEMSQMELEEKGTENPALDLEEKL